MPVLLFVLVAVFGVGFFAREELRARPTAAVQATIAPAHSAWSRTCQARIDQAAREFESEAQLGCHAGSVSVSTLPSGVDYVEYQLTTGDGETYQVTVTEEPQNAGEPSGWRGGPGCRRSYNDFEAVRHENGKLSLVQVKGSRGFRFSEIFQSAADFCVEHPL